MSNQHLFAPGYDNAGGLAALHTLSAPLFGLYRLDLQTEWHGHEQVLPDANRDNVRMGQPSVVVLFAALTAAERQLLRSTYFTGSALQAYVTIQTLDKELGEYFIYSGVARDPEGEWYLGGWKDVRWVIDQLQLRSGFADGFDIRAFGV